MSHDGRELHKLTPSVEDDPDSKEAWFERLEKPDLHHFIQHERARKKRTALRHPLVNIAFLEIPAFDLCHLIHDDERFRVDIVDDVFDFSFFEPVDDTRDFLTLPQLKQWDS